MGGQPAGEDGVRRFVEHQLELTGEEAEQAVRRILGQEIGDRDVTPTGGELQETLTYGINVIRRSEHGPWIGNWQIKACLKQAASRLNIFVEQRGSKGNLSEGGVVIPYGDSQQGDHPDHIYLRNGTAEAKTTWKKFSGRVTGPRGSVSIITDTETAPPGTRFAFEYRFLPGRLTAKDVQQVLALSMICGLGSAKAFERGKFRIEKCEIDIPEKSK